MKVFLISPDEKKFLLNAGDRAPLGLLYISSSLSGNGIDNEVFDLNHYNLEDLLVRIRNEKPDYVGLSIISSPSFKQMRRIGEKIKKISPSTKIIAGGAHVSALPESLEGIADSIIVGYGEDAVIDAINGKTGIIKKSIDVNKFPVPNRYKVSENNYNFERGNLKLATLITSRGCPFSCAFCASHDRHVQFRKPDNIREEIKELKKEGYQAVYILDENFFVNKGHFNAIINIMEEEGMKYKMEMRANDITDDIAKRIKETGCLEVSLGIESGDDEILKKINKQECVEDNKKAIELLGNYGIKTKGFFILGLPGETEETARKTINFAEQMRSKGLTSADFYALTPFPGSAIWDNPEKYGISILSRNFDEFLQKGEPVIETEKLNKKRIKELLEEARGKWTE